MTPKLPFFHLLLVLALGWVSVTHAAGPVPVPAPPALSAKGYLLQDFHSGRMLVESNADERLEPASLTKLMTVYIAFRELAAGNLSLADQVTISEKAWRMKGSRMFIEVGKQVSVEDLLKGIVIQSGNDASVAIAEHIAGAESSFAELMNSHAARLGMKDSHFVNSTGLPAEQHYTTARDLARLTRALISEFPEHYDWHAIKKFTYNNITQYNRNKLLWRDPSVDGVKTGHTESAGYCLVASAKQDNMRLISVVMGSASDNERASDSKALLSYGFRFYETHRLYTAGERVTRTRIWKGATEELPLGLEEDLYVTIPRKQYANLRATMSVDKRIMAPAARGDRYGSVSVALHDSDLAQVPLVALQDVPEGDLWQRLLDEARLWLE